MNTSNSTTTAQPEQSSMNGTDWRTQLQSDSRQRIVHKITDTLKRHIPITGAEGLLELGKVAVRFEQKIYSTAISQSDYLQKISLKLLTMEMQSQNSGDATSLPNSAGGTQNPPIQDSIAQTENTIAADWQEEIFQQIKSMKEAYFSELAEMYRKICLKCQQNSLAQRPDEQISSIKIKMEHIMATLLMSKNCITHNHRETIHAFKKKLATLIQSYRLRELPSHQEQQQVQLAHPLAMRQQHPQVPQQLGTQINCHVQAMNLHDSSMQTTSVTSMLYNPLRSTSTHLEVPTAQAKIMKSLQSASALETGQENASSSLQQGGISMQLNALDPTQQANINSSESVVAGLKPSDVKLQLMKQHQLMQQQLLRQYMLQQQQQQFLQQLQQQKQQQSEQFPPHRKNEDLKMRQGMCFKPGMTQQHHLAGKYPAFHQPITGSQFPISSHLLPVTSPMSQHSFPQIDQQSLLTPLLKTGIPSLSATSFVAPSPSIPLDPSVLPVESENQVSGISFPLNAGNVRQSLATTAQGPAQSLAIGTPKISAAQEFTSLDVIHDFESVSGKANVLERPPECLITVIGFLVAILVFYYLW